MAKVHIRIATPTDLKAITDFLDAHWKKNHIFVTCPEVLLWQHSPMEAADSSLSFVIAEKETTRGAVEIFGLLGFIPFQRFDPHTKLNGVFLAIWKVRDDGVAPPGLGLRLLKYLERRLCPTFVCAIGISEMVKPLYEVLGYTLGALNHVGLFPNSFDHGFIASKVPTQAFLDVEDSAFLSLRSIESEDFFSNGLKSVCEKIRKKNCLQKSHEYLLQRYVKHPWFEYKIWLVEKSSNQAENEDELLVIWRLVKVERATVIRIVDMIGNVSLIAQCAALLRKEIQKEGAEYLDLVAYGIDLKTLRRKGFVDTEAYPDMVLPNYFAPFESRNIELDCAFKGSADFDASEVVLFRGDADQDRPNLAEEVSLREL